MEQSLRYLLEEEETTIRKYTQQSLWIKDGNVVENLRRIIADEEVHVQILKGLLEIYGREGLKT